MWTGADCSLKVCPYGVSHDYISDVTQSLVMVTSDAAGGDPYVGFIPAVSTSVPHVHAFLNNGFLLNRDTGVDIKIVSINPAGASSTLVFQWKLNTDQTFNPEITLSYQTGAGAYLSPSSAYQVRPDLGAGPTDSGLYIWFELTATDFSTPTIYSGDRYFLNVTFNEGISGLMSNVNTLHPSIECSGRGTCDRVAGACVCTSGYTGDNCARTLCPNSCSNRGICQSLQTFYDEGRGGNGDIYAGADASQQYGE